MSLAGPIVQGQAQLSDLGWDVQVLDGLEELNPGHMLGVIGAIAIPLIPPNMLYHQSGTFVIPQGMSAQWVGELARPGSVLDQVARRHSAHPGQIALAWLLQRSPTILPIPGTSSVEHLEENVESAKISLSQDEFKEIYRVAHL